jgi:hypothetical protein
MFPITGASFQVDFPLAGRLAAIFMAISYQPAQCSGGMKNVTTPYEVSSRDRDRPDTE